MAAGPDGLELFAAMLEKYEKKLNLTDDDIATIAQMYGLQID